MRISPDDPRIRPVGRFVRDGQRLVLGWPGTGLDLRFRGRALEIDLAGSRAWIDASLDGGEPFPIALERGVSKAVIPAGGSGDHVVRIRKRTEAMVGDLVLRGIEVVEGDLLEPPDAPVGRLEFYGDSITCGYGCLDPVPEHGFAAGTESFPLSWAGRSAALLDAEVHAMAISGIGAVRNWPGVAGAPLSARWNLAHPSRSAVWDVSRWIPHAVVVNLGTNDFGVLPFPDLSEFVKTFGAWMGRLRAARPGVPVVVVDGPMLAPDHPAPGTRALVRELLDRIASGVGAIRFSLSPCDPSDGLAADFHPSVAQHARNAAEFAPFLRELWEL